MTQEDYDKILNSAALTIAAHVTKVPGSGAGQVINAAGQAVGTALNIHAFNQKQANDAGVDPNDVRNPVLSQVMRGDK